MGLKYPDPPHESVRELLRGLREIAGLALLEDTHKKTLQRAFTSEKPFSRPHQIFFLRVDEFTETRSLKAARLVGWRYFITDQSTGETTVAEVNFDSISARHSFGTFCRRFCEPSILIFLNAESNANFAASNFEVCLLRVPGLHFSALWLKSELEADSFIAITSTVEQAGEMVQLTVGQLIDKLIAATKREPIRPDTTSS